VPGPELPDGSQVGLGDHTAALLDSSSGDLLIRSVSSSTGVLGLDPESNDIEPVATIDGEGELAVGVDGLVHVLEIDSGTITTRDSDGEVKGEVSVDLEGDRPVLTAVGDEPVVLDGDRLLSSEFDPVSVDIGDGAVVQKPSGEAAGVLVAGSDGLVEIDFDGGSSTISDDGSGGAARPMRVGACTYGAWGGSATYLQDCDGSDPVTGTVEGMPDGDPLRFRTNHGRVTLNDLVEGSQLLFGDGDPIFIDADWAEAISDEIEIDPEADIETDDESEARCENRENRPPTAEDDLDIFGTRRGRPV